MGWPWENMKGKTQQGKVNTALLRDGKPRSSVQRANVYSHAHGEG